MKAITDTQILNAEGCRFSPSSIFAPYYEREYEVGGVKFSRRASLLTPTWRGRLEPGESRGLTPAEFDAACERLNANLVRTLYGARD